MVRQFETYQHYKGGIYLKLGEALHTETEEMMVVYVCTVRGTIYCRPKNMFHEDVEVEGYKGPRFKALPDDLTKEESKRVAWFEGK